MNRFLCIVAGLSATALFLAGCGGSSLSSNVARIRAYNGVTATTAQAAIYINSGSANGLQNYQQITSYLYVNSGTSNFGWSVNNLNGGLNAPFPISLNPGGVYSAFLLGRGDQQFSTSSPVLDISVDDQTAPPSGEARIRLVHDAPDAGAVDVYVNGTLQQSDYAYPGTTITGVTSSEMAAGAPFSLQNFGYSNVTAGTLKLQVNEAGTNTIVAGPTTFSVGSGDKYTFVLLEPTVTPNFTYSFQQITDAL